jgi:hypothetical protein
MSVRVEVDDGSRRSAAPRWLAAAFWLALALLLGFTFWLLLNACGLRLAQGSPLLYFCRAPAAVGMAPELGAEIERQRALEGQIERLELALLRAPPCAPTAAAESEAIPEDAWREQDVGFLEGCWELDSDYAISHETTGQTVGVADWRACFDASGSGRQDMTFADGSACGGPLSAAFGARQELIFEDAGNVPCSQQSFISFIYRRVITCQRVDAEHAQCVSRHPETGGQSNVNLRRAAVE